MTEKSLLYACIVVGHVVVTRTFVILLTVWCSPIIGIIAKSRFHHLRQPVLNVDNVTVHVIMCGMEIENVPSTVQVVKRCSVYSNWNFHFCRISGEIKARSRHTPMMVAKPDGVKCSLYVFLVRVSGFVVDGQRWISLSSTYIDFLCKMSRFLCIVRHQHAL